MGGKVMSRAVEGFFSRSSEFKISERCTGPITIAAVISDLRTRVDLTSRYVLHSDLLTNIALSKVDFAPKVSGDAGDCL